MVKMGVFSNLNGIINNYMMLLPIRSWEAEINLFEVSITIKTLISRSGAFRKEGNIKLK